MPPVLAAAVIALAMVITVLIAVLAARHNKSQVDDRDSDTRNFIGAIFSGLFIVVLAFHTVIAWEEANAAEDHVLAEASAVADTYWNMGVAPEPQRARIRAGLLDYLSLVAGQEWPLLAEGKSSGAVDSLLIMLRTEVARLPTTPDQVRAARDRGLDRIREISDHRSARIDQSYGLSPIGHLMLVGTFAGAILVLAYPIMVGFTATARHLVILALTAGVLGCICYVATEITQPYQGWIKVEPDALVSLSEQLQRSP